MLQNWEMGVKVLKNKLVIIGMIIILICVNITNITASEPPEIKNVFHCPIDEVSDDYTSKEINTDDLVIILATVYTYGASNPPNIITVYYNDGEEHSKVMTFSNEYWCYTAIIGQFIEEKTVTYYIEAIDTLSQKTISDTYSFIVNKFEYSNRHSFRIESLDYYPFFTTGDNVTLFVEVKNYGLKDQTHVRLVYQKADFGPSNEITKTRYLDNNQTGIFAFEFTLNHNSDVTATVYVSDVFYNNAISENITFILEGTIDNDSSDNSNEENNIDNFSDDSINDKKDGDTPGFGIIIVIIALMVILYLKRKYE